MKSVHPACGFSLQGATKLLALLGIGISIANYVVALLELKTSMAHYKRQEYELYRNLSIQFTEGRSTSRAVYTGLFVVASLVCLCSVFLDIYLYAAAINCTLKKCRTWFTLSAAIWIVGILQHVYVVVDDGYNVNNVVSIVYLLIDGYILWVVLAFIHEMEVRSASDNEMEYRRME